MRLASDDFPQPVPPATPMTTGECMPVVGPTAPGDELLTLMAAMLACVHGLGMLAFRCCAAAELLYVLGHRNPRSLPLKKSAHYILLLLHHDDDDACRCCLVVRVIML